MCYFIHNLQNDMSLDESYIFERTLLPTKFLEVKSKKGPYVALILRQLIKKISEF